MVGMKKFTAVLSFSLLAACCGRAEDLWKSTPFYTGASIYTEPKSERINLWPAFYHRAPATSVLWPLFSMADDHVALNPFYSQLRQSRTSAGFDEFNVLWPICQFDTLHDRHRIFPFLFWGQGEFYALPLFVSTERLLWTGPLFLRRDRPSGMLLPLFGWEEDERSASYWAGLGLGGCTLRDGAVARHWLLPFYACTADGFYSLPWSRLGDERGRMDLLLCGLAGRKEKGARSSVWTFPVFLWNDEMFLTPLCCFSDATDWVLPLYYRSGERFLSPVYGRRVENGTTTQWFGLPLFGMSSGREEGVWIHPLYSHAADASYVRLRDALEAGRMPVSVTCEPISYTNATGKTVSAQRPVCGDTGYWKGSAGLDFVLKRTATIYEQAEGPHRRNYAIRRDENARVLPLLSGWRTREAAVFDAASRRLLGRQSSTAFEIGGPLFTYESRSDTRTGASSSRSRVLWWLWNREEKNGQVSLDVFPGLTFDTRPDGYVKTSFLWRLFRYENDPAGGVSADVLFVPVAR